MQMTQHAFLDNDFYALTMAQLIWKHYPHQVVTYELINRDDTPLSDYLTAGEVRELLQPIQATKISPAELDYLRAQGLFESDFLDQLATMQMPPVQVCETADGWTVKAQGIWWQAIWWETPALAAITSAYQHRRLAESGISLDQAHQYGLAKLDAKIELLKQHPNIRFAEFGARRRFSRDWQQLVVERLQGQLPHQLAGTSNMMLAQQFGLPMIGTMAHQLFMGTAALALSQGHQHALGYSQQQVLEQWEDMYGSVNDGKLLVFLTDTYSTRLSLRYFQLEMAERWVGMRQDSGDPIAYGERLLGWYFQRGIDPMQHFMLCSDSLTVPKMIEIANHFQGRLPVRFGIGTNLVNDLIHDAPHLVWKIVDIDSQPVVKLSDDPGKFSEPAAAVTRYVQEREKLGAAA